MRRDLTILEAMLADCEAGKATQISLLRVLVAQVRALGADLSEMEEDARREFASEKVGGTD